MASATPSVLFRKYQVDALSALINETPEICPPNVIIQGHQSSGKTLTVRKLFEANPQICNCWLNTVELVTWKPLLQHVARSVSSTLRSSFPHINYDYQDALEAEDFYFLLRVLEAQLRHFDELEKPTSLYIVLDGFDQLKELDLELLPKFIKLHEQLPRSFKIQLRFIYIVRDVAFLHKYSTYYIPTIVFPRYRHEEVAEILLYNKTKEYVESENLLRQVVKCGLDPEDLIFERVVDNYIKMIIQAFHSYTGNDIVALSDIMDSKWDSYVQSITKENIYDPLSLYRSNIEIYTSTGDTFTDTNANSAFDESNKEATAYELSAISKYLLLAAYLCSYLEPRYDSKIFSKKSHLRAGRSSYGRRSKMETNPRYLQPSLFPLERLFSIFQAIFPVGDRHHGKSSIFYQTELMRANVEVYENLAELNGLKLITTATSKGVDYLSYKLKWKINVPWEIINEISSSVGFDIAEYFTGLHN